MQLPRDKRELNVCVADGRIADRGGTQHAHANRALQLFRAAAGLARFSFQHLSRGRAALFGLI